MISKKLLEETLANNTFQDTIAILGVSRATVWKWARFYKIPRKIGCYKDTNYKLNSIQKQIITGSLLGDATLGKVTGTQNSFYKELHSMDQFEYLKWKYDNLIPFSKSFSNNILNNKKYHACTMWTMRHPIFTELEKEWYLRNDEGQYLLKNNKRIKTIPSKIEITPLTMVVWYFDDGWTPKKDRQFFLSTHGFSLNDCEILLSKIKSIGIKNCHIRFRTKFKLPEISINASSCDDFIDMVKEQININCLQYKIKKYF